MIKRLHHVCIAVNNLDESIALFERTLGLKCARIIDVTEMKHREAFFKVGEDGEINLVASTAPDGSVAEFLKSHGQGVAHICFEVDNIDKDAKLMEVNGVKVRYPHERESDGRMGCAFLDVEDTHGVKIELRVSGSEHDVFPR